MQTRKAPISILLTLVATLTLLFGGWFLYTKMEVEEPIRTEIGEMTSAKLADLQVARDEIAVNLQITKPDTFPAEYQSLLRHIEEISPNKHVDITFENQDKALQKIWTNDVFRFTEAVDLHQYSKIPALLTEWKQKNQLDAATSQMDQDNIYIYLKRDAGQFFAIVPRTSPEQGVTGHE
ncbi:hypothetical protein [Brevibacillus fulvus]|uniref:Uncharacterized protein n=1 Tax=Brevibacillus fulvus TaxID=1125967 RepID=A0A938XR99_9BACL|nr:hypothetical protein [Brevibacillus fulvus]MBM7588758.1 hypothetical protein [Brevibacillus fulvus]